jgi:DNA-binding sugar fermentation-stimulating protein
MLLYSLPHLMGATVLRRPSARIRSPYVADIQFDDGTTGLCHTPGLNCSGHLVPGKRIYVSENMDEDIKTKWVVQLSEGRVGIHPIVAKLATYSLLERLHPDAHWVYDAPVNVSRVDYIGYLPDGKKIYVEIKTVMTLPKDHIVVPECKTAKDRIETNVLKGLVEKPDTHSCHFLFIVPHSDCDSIVLEKDYMAKMRLAQDKGLHLHAFVLDYTAEGDILFQKEVGIKM